MIDLHIPTTDGRELLPTRYTEPEPELALLLDKPGKRILLTVASGTLVLMTLGPASGLLGAGSQVSQPPIGVCGGPHVPSVAPAPAPRRIADRDEVAGWA
jgi:hypothetical protein